MAAATHVEFSVRAEPRTVAPLRARVAELALAAGLAPADLAAVRLCVTEALANAIVHAYGGAGGTVEITVEDADSELVVGVRDFGTGLRTRVSPRRDGGFGLRIIERLTRRCAISSAPGDGTEVRMTFASRADV